MNPHIDAIAALPEFIVVATLVLVLVVDLFTGQRNKRLLTPVAALGTVAAFVVAAVLLANNRHGSMAYGGYVVDDFALVAKLIVLGSTAVVLLLGASSHWKGEYLLLVVGATLGMVAIVSAREMVTFIVAFEMLAIPGYMLAGWEKRSRLGHEGALKFYLLGVIATAVMLYGASLVYGVSASTMFDDIAGSTPGYGEIGPLGYIGVLLVIAGIAFKFSAVPFHFWTPDAYQAAPVPVAAFLSVASKAAALFALAELLVLAFPGTNDLWAPLLAILAAVTMTIGNVIALRQRNVVRLLAYSSIAQAGYALVPLAVMGRYGGETALSIEVLFEFLIIFAVTNLTAFAVVAFVSASKLRTFDDWQGLGRRSPVLATAMTLALLSLAGIPPLGGWFAKLVIFRAGIEANGEVAIALVVVAVLNTAIGLYYYAAFAARLWLPGIDDTTKSVTPNKAQMSLVLALTAGVVITGVLPSLITTVGSATTFVQ